jgi:ribonuclease HII
MATDSLHTTTIVGIDEAGYGPLLGPLVVSAVAFEVPVEVLRKLEDPADGPDLWALLRAGVCKRPGRKHTRLAVADSKLLYGGANSDSGVRLLERAALSFLGQKGSMPATMRTLLESACPHVLDQIREYNWYCDADVNLPVNCTADDLGTQRNALAKTLRAAGVEFRGAWVEVLPEGHYNRMVSATRNKARVLFNLTTRLIQRIADAIGPRPMRVWIDRQGGRTGYRNPLLNAFPEARVDVMEESDKRSGYRVTGHGAPLAVRFVEKGETHHMHIALASIYSKYVRELFMMCFNQYWAARVESLRPTAGYTQDGRRFLADIDAIIASQHIDRQWLVRMA